MNKDDIQQNIISALKLESLSSQKKAEIIINATSLVEKRVINRVLESVSNEDIQKFKMEKKSISSDNLAALLKDANLDVVKIIQEEVQKVKKELIDMGDIEED